MAHDLTQGFLWLEDAGVPDGTLPAQEQYQQLVRWAGRARGTNPNEFDALTEWILDDAHWTAEKIAASGQAVMDVIDGFRQQTARLRALVSSMEPQDVVNPAVYKALDALDRVLAGQGDDPEVTAAATRVLADPAALADPDVRKLFAGQKTGPAGVNTVELFGYINTLKNIDAGVQWALFMPDAVRNQQKGFRLTHFAYRTLPAMRFVCIPESDETDEAARGKAFAALDALAEAVQDLPWDIYLSHHNGLGVDVQEPLGFWGRFMPPDTPVPDGFTAIDFVPRDDHRIGPPYMSQMAQAEFAGDLNAMHGHAGYDVNPMYDITRNTMLGQGVDIPYPGKYWTGEIFVHGFHKPSTAYLFSACLQE